MNALRSTPSFLVAALALAAAGPALAHTTLVKSEPARRATLSRPPQQVRLWFNERLEPEYATISVIRTDVGQPVMTQRARVDKDDAKLLVLELPTLSPGGYIVKYRVLSVDGHTVDYGYTFTVKPEGTEK